MSVLHLDLWYIAELGRVKISGPKWARAAQGFSCCCAACASSSVGDASSAEPANGQYAVAEA